MILLSLLQSAGLSVQIQFDRGRFGPIRIFQKEKR